MKAYKINQLGMLYILANIVIGGVVGNCFIKGIDGVVLGMLFQGGFIYAMIKYDL